MEKRDPEQRHFRVTERRGGHLRATEKMSGSYLVPSGHFEQRSMINTVVLRTYAVCGVVFEI